MIEWVVLGALALGGGGYATTLVRRGRAHRKWAKLLSEVAPRTDGRASPASMFDAPQLRAELDGITVTLQLVDIHRGARGRVEAQARLPDPDNRVRLYIGWDVLAAPVDLAHVPEVPYPTSKRIEGTLTVRAEDAAIASRVLDRSLLDLTDIRREAQAKALEIIARGGYVMLVLHGLEPTAALLERSLRITAALARTVDASSKGTLLAPGPTEAAPSEPASDATDAPPASPRNLACELCAQGERSNQSWVACSKCGRPYHADCFQQATACLVEGCGGTRADPVDPAS